MEVVMADEVKDDQVQNPNDGQGNEAASSDNQGAPESHIPAAEDDPVLLSIIEDDGTEQGVERKLTKKEIQEMHRRSAEYDALKARVDKVTQDFSRVSNRAAAYERVYGPIDQNNLPAAGTERTPTPVTQTQIDPSAFKLTREDWLSADPEAVITEKFNNMVDYYHDRLLRNPVDRQELLNNLRADPMREEAYQVIAEDPFLREHAGEATPDGSTVSEHLMGVAAVLAAAEMNKTGDYSLRSPAKAWAWFKNHPIYGIRAQAQASGSRTIRDITSSILNANETPSGGGGTSTGLAAQYVRMTRREQIDWENKATSEQKAQLAEELRTFKQ
jgi:hypothetical protein